MIILYRTSSHGYNKVKLYGDTNKYHCLVNFLDTWGFSRGGDNCINNEDTLLFRVDNSPDLVRSIDTLCHSQDPGYAFAYSITETSYGSSGASFRGAFEHVMEIDADPNTIVYFLEDDYMHRPNARAVLSQGLERVDYVSGYDHPDKYIDASQGGNPHIEGGGEVTRVFLTKDSHWKLTNSTTMTFATKLKTLREDADIIRKHCQGEYPTDYAMFLELRDKGRSLATPIPGVSTHTEIAWLTPLWVQS